MFFRKTKTVKLTQVELMVIANAIYTQIEVIKGLKRSKEMKNELKIMGNILKKIGGPL